MRLLLVLSMLLSIPFNHCKAQSGVTIWESTSVKYDALTEESALQSQFVFEGNKIQWIQNNGAHTYEFDILEKVGEWSDYSQDGSIVYKVKNTRLTGEIRAERKAASLVIHVTISGKGNQMNGITCKISNISSR